MMVVSEELCLTAFANITWLNTSRQPKGKLFPLFLRRSFQDTTYRVGLDGRRLRTQCVEGVSVALSDNLCYPSLTFRLHFITLLLLSEATCIQVEYCELKWGAL